MDTKPVDTQLDHVPGPEKLRRIEAEVSSFKSTQLFSSGLQSIRPPALQRPDFKIERNMPRGFGLNARLKAIAPR